ncbi:HD domain-containing protein [Clostridium sp. Marseille-P2415]|uniref:HD domain-containing protein n=1 Tax=Clostridium sp. Marseille-P2415 TaxID=1805471 RepID=UPI0009888AF6|nr:HD domain-containing protein [Clostridium sp. Marseille-P2415]
MNPQELIKFLGILEKLKCNTRHNWTTNGRQESVAEHSWRLAVMAMLMEKDFPELHMDKVIRMCLIHDWGEALTGDIPAFEKTGEDEAVEDEAVRSLLERLPEHLNASVAPLFEEMARCETKEARLCKALDKIETLIQHNEAGTKTWLPLEYDLNLTYGNEICESFQVTRKLRDEVRRDTMRLMEEEKHGN